MKEQTAHIIKSFIKEMEKDFVGWIPDFIGSEAYQLYRILEHPQEIPEDKK